MLVDSHSHFDAPEFDGDRDAVRRQTVAAALRGDDGLLG